MNDINDFGMFTDQGEVVAEKVVTWPKRLASTGNRP